MFGVAVLVFIGHIFYGFEFKVTILLARLPSKLDNPVCPDIKTDEGGLEEIDPYLEFELCTLIPLLAPITATLRLSC